jgi:hypothetical protein
MDMILPRVMRSPQYDQEILMNRVTRRLGRSADKSRGSLTERLARHNLKLQTSPQIRRSGRQKARDHTCRPIAAH